MKADITKDINGKESSKRLWANRFFIIGVIAFIISFAFWFISLIKPSIVFSMPGEIVEMWAWLMGFGSAVILGTVFEKPKARWSDNNPKWRDTHNHYDGPPNNGSDGAEDGKPYNYDEVD